MAILTAGMGLFAFSSVAGNPRFETYHTLDVIGLMVAGAGLRRRPCPADTVLQIPQPWFRRQEGKGAGDIIAYQPNPHKVLAVKRKYFPRPRGFGVSLTPFLRGHSSGGEGRDRSATRLDYPKQTRLLAPKAEDEPHPTRMRTPAAPLRGARRLCQGTRPGRSRYSFVPRPVASRKTAGSSPPRERPVRQGSRCGAGRQAMAPPSSGPRFGGGRVDVGMAPRRQARTH